MVWDAEVLILLAKLHHWFSNCITYYLFSIKLHKYFPLIAYMFLKFWKCILLDNFTQIYLSLQLHSSLLPINCRVLFSSGHGHHAKRKWTSWMDGIVPAVYGKINLIAYWSWWDLGLFLAFLQQGKRWSRSLTNFILSDQEPSYASLMLGDGIVCAQANYLRTANCHWQRSSVGLLNLPTKYQGGECS